MFSSNGDDFQPEVNGNSEDVKSEPEVELEAGPRAERPNFLTATRFTDFDLPPEIMAGLDKAGFEYCTPIQAQAIPVAMAGLDIAGQAQTGTGKTTAFLVPLLNRLLKNKPLEPGVPRALIVTPTRELALQIHEDAQVLAEAPSQRQVLVIGGMDYKEQADLLRSAPEIVICTPGRIIDYLQQGVFKTKGIEVAVVDEADRLLDMGFIKDLKYLLGKLPPFTQRQTMLFSATLDDRVMELTYQFMNPPQYITAEPDKNTKVSIEQELYHIGRDEKMSLLLGLLRREEHHRVIIFANTKSGVEWLAKKLTMNGFQAEGITGDLPQPKRLKLMEAFKENRLQILVATDVASRGIHVDDVSHVYNYDLPQDAENYVHRIGRTARAGNTGKAVSFGCEDYVFHLEAIENLLGEKIPVFWAEQDWFQEDQGGEVKLRDRRGSDRRKPERRGTRDSGGREGGPRISSRAPAKSQRPGGIFGLAPRLSGEGQEDPRQVLTWTVAGDEPAVIEGEVVETVAETADKDGRDGRRRKRRRGRRGRETGPVEATSAVGAESSEPAAQEKAPAGEPGAPEVKSEDQIAAEAPVKRPRTAGRSRRSSGPDETQIEKAAQETGQTATAVETGAQQTTAGPAEVETTSEQPAKSVRKPSRRGVKADSQTGETGPEEKAAPKSLRTARKKSPAEAPPAATAPANVEAPKEVSRYPSRSIKKTLEEAERAKKAEAEAAAETGAKKTTVAKTPRKKPAAAPAETPAEVAASPLPSEAKAAAKKPALKKTTPKVTAETEAVKKTAAKKPAISRAKAEPEPQTGAEKKTPRKTAAESPAQETKKTAAKKESPAPKKAPIKKALGEADEPKKTRASRAKSPESEKAKTPAKKPVNKTETENNRGVSTAGLM